jgi:hypothetical protein
MYYTLTQPILVYSLVLFFIYLLIPLEALQIYLFRCLQNRSNIDSCFPYIYVLNDLRPSCELGCSTQQGNGKTVHQFRSDTYHRLYKENLWFVWVHGQ